MKNLLLMRHAKSSWDDESQPDHERPLNSRGERDAPRMGKLLKKQKLLPDLIVSSSARRAADTAELLAQGCKYKGEIALEADLYHAAGDDWERVIRKLPSKIETALLIGHNPSIEVFQEHLTGIAERFPTAAIAWLVLDADDWSQLGSASIELRIVWCPKELD